MTRRRIAPSACIGDAGRGRPAAEVMNKITPSGICDPQEVVMTTSNQRIAERAPVFLRNTRKNAQTMKDAFDSGDLDTVISLGHRMNGAGAIFGFQGITDIGAAIEHAARRGDVDMTRKSMKDLATYLDRVSPISEPKVG